jgi:exopolyphosphatase
MSQAFQLSKFLLDLKEKYLSDVRGANGKASEWTVVMGNEAGGEFFPAFVPRVARTGYNINCWVALDLDTLASSITYSWLETEVHKRQTIALIRFEKKDLVLRRENIHALTLAGLTADANELLFIDELPESKVFPSHKFALVDHNHIGSSFIANNPTAQVVAVVDHHEDEGLYKNANPRIVVPAGSCTSLIAHLCPPEIPAELATLLLCAMLIDTGDFKEGGKALQVDRDAATFLLPRSTLASSLPHDVSTTAAPYDAPAIKDLAAELEAQKDDVSNLSVRDLLRRDYKEYTYQLPWADARISIKAGLSTVPLGLDTWITHGRLEQQAQPWMESRGLAVHGILTSYKHKSEKSGKGKHRREQLWIVREGAETIDDTTAGTDGTPSALSVETLAERLFTGLVASKELELKRNKEFEIDKKGKLPAGMKARVYDQKNTEASRKVTAPTLQIILANPGPLPEVITIEEDKE